MGEVLQWYFHVLADFSVRVNKYQHAHVQLAQLLSKGSKTVPLDEVVPRAEIGGPLKLEVVDWCPWVCRAHPLELALCHEEPPASCC